MMSRNVPIKTPNTGINSPTTPIIAPMAGIRDKKISTNGGRRLVINAIIGGIKRINGSTNNTIASITGAKAAITMSIIGMNSKMNPMSFTINGTNIDPSFSPNPPANSVRAEKGDKIPLINAPIGAVITLSICPPIAKDLMFCKSP